MSKIANSIRYTLNTVGILGLTLKIIAVVRRLIWSKVTWNIYECETTHISVPASFATVHHLLEFNELAATSYPKVAAFPDAIRKRFGLGHQCHGFFVGTELATIGWSMRAGLELDVHTVIPFEGAIGLYDFLTLNEYRGKGFYVESLQVLLQYVAKQGAGRAVIAADPGNLASIRGILRAGFSLRRTFVKRTILGFSFITSD